MIEYRTEVSVVETKEKQFGISLLLILSIFLGVCFGSADRDFPHTARYEFSQNKAISYNVNDGVANSAEMLEARSAIELINDTVRHSTGKKQQVSGPAAFAGCCCCDFQHFLFHRGGKMDAYSNLAQESHRVKLYPQQGRQKINMVELHLDFTIY